LPGDTYEIEAKLLREWVVVLSGEEVDSLLLSRESIPRLPEVVPVGSGSTNLTFTTSGAAIAPSPHQMAQSITSRLAITAARRTSSRVFFAQSRHYAAETAASTEAASPTRSLQDLEGSYESMSLRIRELNNELVPQQGPPAGPAEGLPRHQPDYDAAVDYRTSYVGIVIAKKERPLTPNRSFSPVPKRLMDGSEPGETVAAAVLSGAPSDLQARTVRYMHLLHLSFF
jgi:hypothetical protein